MAVGRRNPALAVGFYVLFALFPLCWLLKVAVTPDQLIFTEGTRLWPSEATLDNFRAVLPSDFLLFFRNSVVVSLSTAAVTALVAAGAGYALSRFRFRAKRWVVALLLLTQMFPLLMIILGTTTVYVTHDQVEAMTLADRIVVMQGGRVEQVGAPMKLYDRPANRFVAGFIGSPAMNVVEGEPVPGGLRLGDGTVWPAPPGTVALGVRPEHLQPAPGPTGVTAELQVIERLGSDTNLFCEAPGVGPLLARLHGDVGLAPGAAVALAPDLDRLHPFDAAGRRIAS